MKSYNEIYIEKKLYWFIKIVNDQINSLGFIYNNKLGAFIIGGETGSHCSGHKDKIEEVYNEILLNNYIELEEAKQMDIIDKNYIPKIMLLKDRQLLEKFIND